MLNMIIYFLELDDAKTQLRETRKGAILFGFRLMWCYVLLKQFAVFHS